MCVLVSQPVCSKVMAAQGCNILISPGSCKVTAHLEDMSNLVQENPIMKDITSPLIIPSGACLATEQLSHWPHLQAWGDTGRRQLCGCWWKPRPTTSCAKSQGFSGVLQQLRRAPTACQALDPSTPAMVVAAQHAAQIGAASRGATSQDPRQLSGHSLIDSSRPQASAHQGRLHSGPSHHPGTAQVTWLIKKSTEVHFSDPS